jgi:sugar phosphate isomerase/epimerase
VQARQSWHGVEHRPDSLGRRRFLGGLSALAACATLGTEPASAAEPFPRVGEPRFRLGLAAYSLRNYFSFMKGKPRTPADPNRAIDMFGFVDYCGAQGFLAAELTSYFFPPNADEEYFRKIKRHAFLQGVEISGTAIGNNFTQGAGPKMEREIESAMQWIDNAAVMGAPHIRFFAGTGSELDRHPERMEEAVAAMKRCAALAAKKGVFLGIENHGRLRPDQLLPVIEQVDHPWVGINLDTGNFVSEDPYADLEKCAPYAVNVQVKVTMRTASGKKEDADFDRIGKILKDANYQGYVVLEYEEQDPYEHIPEATEKLRRALGV